MELQVHLVPLPLEPQVWQEQQGSRGQLVLQVLPEPLEQLDLQVLPVLLVQLELLADTPLIVEQ